MTDENDKPINDGPKKTATAGDAEHTAPETPKDKPSTEQKNTDVTGAGSKDGKTLKSAAPAAARPKADKKNNAAKKRRSLKAPQNTECQNCGATLVGDYCHQCGQAAKEPRRLVIGLVQDVFVETLAIDGKLARSIALLLWRPGVLARRFLEGKRVRYSPPFRLFLFASVFFFFAAFWLMDTPDSLPIEGGASIDPAAIAEAKDEIDDAREEIAATLGDAAPEMVEEALNELDQAIAEAPGDASNDAPIDASDDAAPVGAPPTDAGAGEDADDDSNEEAAGDVVRSFKESTWADANYSGPASLEPHLKRLYEASQRVLDDPRLFYAEMRANVPRFLLLAPVIYGLTLTLLYFYRRKFFIYDHFIVSLYMHAALYAYLLTALLVNRIPVVGGWLWFAPIAWGMLQPLVVLRQAYGSNWFSVWIKWFISIAIYLMALVVIIMLGLSYSLYQS